MKRRNARRKAPEMRCRILSCLMILGCLCLWATIPEKSAAAGETDLTVEVSGKESLEYLEDYGSLESLTLRFTDSNNEYSLDTLPRLPSLKSLTIVGDMDLEISEAVNSKGLERNRSNISFLHLDGVDVGPGPVEKLENLDTLKLDNSWNPDVDFSRLSLNQLDLSDMLSYNIPMFLSYEDYKGLEKKGTQVVFRDGQAREKAEKTWKWVEEKADEIGLEDVETEQEKVDMATAFVMEELEYDEDIARQLEETGEPDYDEVASFYDDGTLCAVMEKDSAICGNYAALLKALLVRSDVDCLSVLNNNHAWNLLEADGITAYVDPTFLDAYAEPEVIRRGVGQFYTWHMEGTSDEHIKEIDDREPPVLFPEYIRLAGEEPGDFTEQGLEMVEDLDIDQLMEDLDVEQIIEDLGLNLETGSLNGMNIEIEESPAEAEETGKDKEEAGLFRVLLIGGIIFLAAGGAILLVIGIRRRRAGEPVFEKAPGRGRTVSLGHEDPDEMWPEPEGPGAPWPEPEEMGAPWPEPEDSGAPWPEPGAAGQAHAFEEKASRPPRATLSWKKKKKKARLRKSEYRIGKGRENNDLVVDNKAVSRTHAVIRRIDGSFWIYDMGSANGTFVNGHRVTGKGRKLHSGDRIRLADEEFRFRLEEE